MLGWKYSTANLTWNSYKNKDLPYQPLPPLIRWCGRGCGLCGHGVLPFLVNDMGVRVGPTEGCYLVCDRSFPSASPSLF
jgi:hypothetical protein